MRLFEVTLAGNPIAWFVDFQEAMHYKRTWKTAAKGTIKVRETDSDSLILHIARPGTQVMFSNGEGVDING